MNLWTEVYPLHLYLFYFRVQIHRYLYSQECKFPSYYCLFFEIYVNGKLRFCKLLTALEQSMLVYICMWFSVTFLREFLKSFFTRCSCHLFHEIVLAAVTCSGTSACLNQYSEFILLFRKQWKIISGRNSTSLYILIQSIIESAERLKCFKSDGKASKSPKKEERRNDDNHSRKLNHLLE